MLTKFSVSNFKSFNQEFVFDLHNTNGYEFNKESVKNGVVNHALIYGHNGVGKSNLGLALFDVIGHLTDMQTNETEYLIYLNALNKTEYATFRYELLIDNHTVVYEYRKTTHKTLVYERFSINGKDLALIDRTISDEASIDFEGAENLKTELSNKNWLNP